MKILLLGGTGAMGLHLIEILSKDKKNHVVVTSRGERKNNQNVTYLKGDAHDLGFIQPVLAESWDVIIDFMVYNTTKFNRRLDLLLSATKQYVFLSSARVYSSATNQITESQPRLLDVVVDDEYLATDEYALTKARQENSLLESKYKNWTVIRPYITFSDERLQLGVLEKEDWLYRALQGRPIVFAKEMLDKVTTLTYGFDVATGICAIIGKKQALSETFHITSNQSLPWRDVLNSYLTVLEKHLGYRPKVVLQDVNDFYKCHPAKYQIKYDRLFDRQFDNSKINEFINVSEFADVHLALQQGLGSFLSNQRFKAINWQAEAKKDKACGVVASLKEIPTFKKKIRYLLSRYLSI
ncbi:NAD-dependent epimerase/dehydratase family protein [Aeromonas enteropelogenes]|uniref:NAD-dependent epimerase/dehydratase family protein n=1 Tax=Aeromonas enteropelogenes TaxID=29489 RepID=UPI003B9FDA0D